PEAGRPALVPLPRFLAGPEAWRRRPGPLGLRVAPGEDVRPLASHLAGIALVAIAFPTFSDGRGYSAARLLRERLGFTGEIRAVGEVLLDQIELMRRCGFDSFSVGHEPTRRALAAGRSGAMRHHYQPVGTVPELPAGTRPWARLSPA
ncbi:DUF934 domain-containing protein, partial [Propylenella binzhouense]